MARAPRAKVSQTSGQGVSRYSYQKGYSLGNRGGGAPAPGVSTKFSNETKPGRGGKQDYPAGMNVSFGDTSDPTNLGETKKLLTPKAPTSVDYGKPAKGSMAKPEKGASGWKS